LLILVVCILAVPAALDAASLMWRDSQGCRIWSVVDGDTVRAVCPDAKYVAADIKGYNAPELQAGCGREFVLAIASTFVTRWEFWTADEVIARAAQFSSASEPLQLVVSVDGLSPGVALVNAGLARWDRDVEGNPWCA
jgi:micrococcal nuclease